MTIVGSIPGLNPGETVKLQGEWQNHARYGRQFKMASCEMVMPATVSGIERYLGSGMIKGIGPVMAKRLVSKFATETLDVIDQDIGAAERSRRHRGKADRDDKERLAGSEGDTGGDGLPAGARREPRLRGEDIQAVWQRGCRR